MARTPMMHRLRRAFAKALWALDSGVTEPAALDAAWRAALLTRRDTLRVAGAAGVVGLAACAEDPSDLRDVDEVKDGRVAVIGAGIAGLHCAWRLTQAGVPAVVYEADSRVGGRMFSGRGLFLDDQVCELGGEFIDTTFASMWAIAEELGIVLDDRLADVPEGYVADTWWFGDAAVDERDIVQQFIEVAPTFVAQAAEADSDEATFAALDATSLADWLDTYVPRATYRALHDAVRQAYIGEFGREAEDQSCLNMLYLIGADEPDPFRVFGDSDERWHAHLGNDTFATLIAAQLSPEQVVTDARLTKIIEAEGTFTLELARSDGTTFSANFDHVVLALPFTTLRDVDLDAVTLSDEKRTIVAELGYGTNAKVMGGFSSKVWRETYAASGAMVTDLPAQQTWDTSIGQEGPSGIITNFLGGAQGEASGEGDAPTWFAEVAVPALEAAWPGCAAAYTGTAVRMHWPTAPHAKGSYACYRPGQWAFWGLEGVREGNLHFCGEHTSLDFQGWMEGGAETGALVAAEILDDLGVAYSRGHRAALGDKRLLPQATYHGDAQPRLRWTERRRLLRALRG